MYMSVLFSWHFLKDAIKKNLFNDQLVPSLLIISIFSWSHDVWFKGDLWEDVNCKSLLGVRGLRWMGISVSEIRLRLVFLYWMLLNNLWQVDWSQRYDVCHKQLARLSAQGIQQFVDSITFSELAVDTIPVENRVEIVNRALRFARQQDAALKKKGISESQEERYKLFVVELNIGLDLSDVVMELWLGSLHSSFRTKHHSYHCTVSAPKKAKWFCFLLLFSEVQDNRL